MGVRLLYTFVVAFATWTTVQNVKKNLERY